MTSARYPTKLEIEPIEMAVYLGGPLCSPHCNQLPDSMDRPKHGVDEAICSLFWTEN